MGGLTQTRLCEEQPDLSFHVIGVSSDDGVTLWVRDLRDGGIGKLSPVSDGRIDIFVSEERRCVGRLHDGVHVPCPDDSAVTRFRQCPGCNDSSIKVQSCVFSPICHGERCPGSSCSEPHIVYLGSVRSATKVGMTRESRMLARGREQGLDAMSVLRRPGDRLSAREAELGIARALSVPERIDAHRFAMALAEPLDRGSVLDVHRGAAERLGAEAGVTWFTGYPMPQLERAPRPVPVVGAHHGRVTGSRGRYLVYDGRLLDMGALPSRKISLDRDAVRWVQAKSDKC